MVGKSRRGVKCGDDNKRIGQHLVNFFDNLRELVILGPGRRALGRRRAFRPAHAMSDRVDRMNVKRGLHRLTQIAALTNGIFCDRGATSSDDNDDDPSRDGDNNPSSEPL